MFHSASFSALLALWLAAVNTGAGAVFVDGDYNADGLADLAFYDEATGLWNISNLAGVPVAVDVLWGGPGLLPVSGDYDGDGIWDLAVYSTQTGKWFIKTVAGAWLLLDQLWGAPGMVPVSGDYDGDGIWDLVVFDPPAGCWYMRTMAGNCIQGEFMAGAGLTPVPGDYDGDAHSDLAVYDEATGQWSILVSGMGLVWFQHWGAPGLKPVRGDYDGDGVADLAVRSSADGMWHVYSLKQSKILAANVAFGRADFSAVAADFDGDFRADPLTYDKSTRAWSVSLSHSGYAAAAGGGRGVAAALQAAGANPAGSCMALTYAPASTNLGQSGLLAFVGDFDGNDLDEIGVYQPGSGRWYLINHYDGILADYELGGPTMVPVLGDYDGDGKTDLAVYDCASAFWAVIMSSGRDLVGQFGNATSVPVPGDYDGDGLTDVAVYQPETGVWQAFLSATESVASYSWGLPGGEPVPADYDGDGRTDLAVFVPGQAQWHVLKSGGGIIAQTFGWEGCEPIPADFDEDGQADMAVYWAAGGKWLVHSSASDFTWSGTWRNPPGVSAPAQAQAFSARFGVGTDRRLCVLDTPTGSMLAEPVSPALLSCLGKSLLPIQDLKSLLDAHPAAVRGAPRPKVVGEIIEIILSIGESIIEDFEQAERDAQIEEMNAKLDTISSNVLENSRQLNNLMSQLAMTRAQLESSIWQAELSRAIKELHNTHQELKTFDKPSYNRLRSLPETRKLKVTQYRENYGKRDILGKLSDMHTHIVGEGQTAIPSSLELWKEVLVAKIKGGQKVMLAYKSLEAFFTELLGYQVEGLQVYGHHVLYTNAVIAAPLYEEYIQETFLPRIAQQTEVFLNCVDALAAASLDLNTEVAALPQIGLPEGVAEMYQAADFLAASVSTGRTWGLAAHVIGEPENVQAYADHNQFGYYSAQETPADARLLPVETVRNLDGLRKSSYLSWSWWTNGAFCGYNKFKTENRIAVTRGAITNLALGNYVVCAPWGNNAQGRQAAAEIKNYDSQMQPLAPDATNGYRFGSVTLYVRSQPALMEGEKTQTDNFLMTGDCFSFIKEINPARGSAAVRVKTDAVKNTPWFWLEPAASDQASLVLPVCNGNAAATKVKFSTEADVDLTLSNDSISGKFSASCPINHGYGRMGIECGSWWWGSYCRVEGLSLTGRVSESQQFEATVPAGGPFNLKLMAFQRTVWYGSMTWYACGTWNETKLTVKNLGVE